MADLEHKLALGLRKDVVISVSYSFVHKCEYLTIKFPLALNHDLHHFLCRLGTIYQRHYVQLNGKIVPYVRHELTKEEAERIANLHLYSSIPEYDIMDSSDEEDMEQDTVSTTDENMEQYIDSMTDKEDEGTSYSNDDMVKYILEEVEESSDDYIESILEEMEYKYRDDSTTGVSSIPTSILMEEIAKLGLTT